MINASKIKIKTNYVLIKPDADHEKLSNGLYIGSTKETEARHYAITGTVLIVPDRLVYRGKEAKNLRAKTGGHMDEFDAKDLISILNGSMRHETDMEIEVGDKVYFDYIAQFNANTEGKSIQVEGHGECILMEYSMLSAVQKGEEFIPINGYIWIRMIQDTHDLGNDIIIPDTVDTTVPGIATVVKVGKPIKEYLSAKHSDQGLIGLTAGQTIMFYDAVKTPLEYALHETDEMKGLYKIMRKDIHAILPDGFKSERVIN